MRLDNDMIRDMLMQIEMDVDGRSNFSIDDYCSDKLSEYDLGLARYHLKYLIDADFIQAGNGYFRDITPTGRAFLDNIRDNGVWAETKKAAAKSVGSVALDVIAEIAASIVKKALNLP